MKTPLLGVLLLSACAPVASRTAQSSLRADCSIPGSAMLNFNSAQTPANFEKAVTSTYPADAATQIRQDAARVLLLSDDSVVMTGEVMITLQGLGCFEFSFDTPEELKALTLDARQTFVKKYAQTTSGEGVAEYLRRKPLRVRVHVTATPGGHPKGHTTLLL